MKFTKKLLTGIMLFSILGSSSFARSHSSSHHSSYHHSSSSHKSYSKPSKSYSKPKSYHSSTSKKKISTSNFSNNTHKKNTYKSKKIKSVRKTNKKYNSHKINKYKQRTKPSVKRKKVYVKKNITVINKTYKTRNNYYSNRHSFYGGYHNPYMGYGYYHQSYGMFDTMWLLYILDNYNTNVQARKWYSQHQSDLSDFQNSELINENAELKAKLNNVQSFQNENYDNVSDIDNSEFALSEKVVDEGFNNQEFTKVKNENAELKMKLEQQQNAIDAEHNQDKPIFFIFLKYFVMAILAIFIVVLFISII